MRGSQLLLILHAERIRGSGATFLEDLKDHMDEFINASMEEHKTCCFKKTVQKVS